MEPVIVLLLIGFIYVILFGGLSWMRREGLSTRFAIEAIIFTLLVSAFVYLTKISFHPAIFMVILYLITVRVRLLIDWANNTARSGDYKNAEQLYELALKAYPDPVNLLMVKVNQGVCWLQQGKLDEAIDVFKYVLSRVDEGIVGIKYEAATHYNLGIAYRRKGMEQQAAVEFNNVLDIFPSSVYARRAEDALNEGQQLKSIGEEESKQE
jgi:tetratricopeptide (TPR) repeat protein